VTYVELINEFEVRDVREGESLPIVRGATAGNTFLCCRTRPSASSSPLLGWVLKILAVAQSAHFQRARCW
jgi:hypothetical protein